MSRYHVALLCNWELVKLKRARKVLKCILWAAAVVHTAPTEGKVRPFQLAIKYSNQD